jgi:hypothetical protein
VRRGLGRDLRRDRVIRVRIEAGRIGDDPGQEILDAALLVQLPEQTDGVGTVESGSEDEQAKRPAEDSPSGVGRVGDREVPFLGRRDRRPSVNEVGRFFSYS